MRSLAGPQLYLVNGPRPNEDCLSRLCFFKKKKLDLQRYDDSRYFVKKKIFHVGRENSQTASLTIHKDLAGRVSYDANLYLVL